MDKKCDTCGQEPLFYCRCNSKIHQLCQNCALEHLKTTANKHYIGKITENFFCNECEIMKTTWKCMCKGNSTYVCNNCLQVHINRNIYSSHNFAKYL